MDSTSVILKSLLVLLFVLQMLKEGVQAKRRKKESQEEESEHFKNSEEMSYDWDRRSIFYDVGVDRLLNEGLGNRDHRSPRRPAHREYRKRGHKEDEINNWESHTHKERIYDYRDDKKYNSVGAPRDWSKPGGYGNGPWGRRVNQKKQSVKAEQDKPKGQGRDGKGWIGWGYWG